MANTPDNFSDKVLAKLKEKNMAVDLTDEPIGEQPQVEAQSEPMQAFSDQGFTAFAASGTAPVSGGNKDILIIPGYGGTTASAASQINFYWIEPSTLPTDNITDATGTTRRSTLFNYSDDLNNPVLAFGGYNGTLNLAPAGTYGGSTTNSVAKIWIHPFTGTIDTDYMNFGTNTVTASTSSGVLSWVPGSTRLSVGDGTNAKQIAYTSDVTSANQITASANNTDTTLYPLFISDPGDGTTNRVVYTGDATYSPILNGTNGNLTIAGDLAVNGLDITTGTAGTASLFNANATTLNMGSAATAVSIGASTGTLTVGNTTVTFTNATSFTGTASAITFFGASTSVTAFGGATALGLGSSTGTTTINNTTVAFPQATSFTGTSAAVTFLGTATTVTAFGAAATLGIGSSTGTLTIGNPTIATGTTSLTLFNTSATTVNAFGAATALGLGSSTGTTTINNTTVAFPQATSFTGTSAAVTFLGTATTATVFGAATSLTLGATSGTGTIRNATIDFPNATTISGSASLATVFSTANPSSLAVFGAATTATIFGSGTSITLGTTSGTTTINNTTVAFPNATSFTGTSATVTFLGTATTATVFGAATSLTLGATSGTGTIRNATIDFPNATTISGSASLATVFSTANPSSLAVFGAATTATIFGSGTSITLGTTSGTTTINNTTVAFPQATSFTGTSGTITFFGGAGTVTSFGGATALILGAATGTTTIRNTTVTFTNATNITGTTGTLALFAEPTTVTAFAGATTSTMFGTTASSTINFGAGALGSGNTRTINIGNNAVATSTSVIYIGSALNTSNSTISFNGNRIQSVGEPTSPSDAATKYYVDSFQAGLDLHESVRAIAATAIGTSVLYFQQNAASSTLGTVVGTSYIESSNNETLSTTYFDNLSTALAVGNRVLVASGASTTTYNINGVTTAPAGATNVMNGIYTVTSVGGAGSKWRLDRATDTNDNIELQGGTFTFVQEGAIYDNSGWVCTNNTATTPISIGADAISWTQFSGAGLILAGDGLVKTGNTIDAVGTANRISVSANAIDIAATYVGQSSITTLGTITTGTWNASTVPLLYGGTGTTSYASNNGLIFYDNTNTRLSTLTTGASTTVLVGTGSGTLPSYAQVNLGTMVTGTLPLANGGLGTTTFTQYGVLYGNAGTSVLVTATGSTDQVLKSGAGAAAPAFGSINLASSNAVGSSILPAANGGTGTSSLTSNAVLVGNGTGTVTLTSTSTQYKVFVAGVSGAPTWGTVALDQSAAISGILPVANGGTATSSFATTNGFVYFDGSKLVTSGAATSGQLLLSGTTGTVAAWTSVTGDVTINGSGTTAIGTNKVTNAMLRQSAGFSVIGKTDTGTGNVADITASATDSVLRYNGTNVSFGAINLSSSNAVTGTLAVGAGGTGTSSYNFGGVVYAGSTAATGLLSVAPAAANKHLVSTGTGTGNYPVWSTATMATTYTAGNILYASATDTVGGLATSASSALVSNASGTPSWASGVTANRVLRTDGTNVTFSQVALGTDVSGTLANTNGGTGQNSAFTANALVYASSTTALATGALLTWIPVTTTGTGSTAALYVNPSSLTSGTAVNINLPSGGSSGKIIVGQLNGTDKFSVDANGNLRATTKSFDIEHPTKPGMRLVYGVLEGPEHGVYHRGTVEGKGKLVIELPEYWHKLVGENYTIQLTPWGNYAVHIVEKTENYFIIELSSNALVKKFKSIKVDYIIHGSRLDAPLEIEQ